MIIIHYLHLLKHPTIIYITIQENLPITDISYHLFILFTNTLLILIVTHCLFYQTILQYWYCLPIFITIHYQYFSLVIFSQKYPMIIHILTDADLNNEYIYSYINHISVQMHHIYYLILIFKGYSLAPPYSVNNWVKCYRESFKIVNYFLISQQAFIFTKNILKKFKIQTIIKNIIHI